MACRRPERARLRAALDLRRAPMPDCEAEEDERGRLMGEGEGNRHGEDERRDTEAGLQGGDAGNERGPLREREWR